MPAVNVLGLAAVLRARSVLHSHEGWSRQQLEAHQARALTALRAFALAHSPLYRELHRDLEGAPLADLPVLTKATLMERFDDLITDRAVRLIDVERHLERATAADRFRGRYRVAATGGTTGRRGVFLSDPAEWTQILASYSRAYAWAGLEVGLAHRLRMAIVSSRVATHSLHRHPTAGFPLESVDGDPLLIEIGERYHLLVTLRRRDLSGGGIAEGKGAVACALMRA